MSTIDRTQVVFTIHAVVSFVCECRPCTVIANKKTEQSYPHYYNVQATAFACI